jgi:hypothetical protein
MAAGVPPIAANHGSFTELITPGVDGVLFNPGDPAALALAIADVERNPEQYEAYGDQARKTYEQRFDPQRSVEELLEIYRFAIAHPVLSHPRQPVFCVHQWDGQHVRVGVAEVAEQGQAAGVRGGLGDGHADADDGVRAQPGLARRPVQVDQGLVDQSLVVGLVAERFRLDLVDDALDRAGHALMDRWQPLQYLPR